MQSKNPLPLKSKLSYAYISSLLIALLTGVVSISGLLFKNLIYQTEELIQTYVPNDIINLLIGIPILIVSVFATNQTKVMGLLFWIGAIIFNLYNLISYLFALPFRWNYLIYLCLVILDIITLIKLVISIDGEKLENKFRDRVYERFCGGALAVFGILFLARAISVLSNVIFFGEVLSKAEIAPNLSDLFISPAFVIVGISLWKKKALGYIGGLGLLFLASMLFVGLILFLLLQPLLTNTSFSLGDVIIVTVMGFICFVPFSLFVRGVALNSKSKN